MSQKCMRQLRAPWSKVTVGRIFHNCKPPRVSVLSRIRLIYGFIYWDGSVKTLINKLRAI